MDDWCWWGGRSEHLLFPCDCTHLLGGWRIVIQSVSEHVKIVSGLYLYKGLSSAADTLLSRCMHAGMSRSIIASGTLWDWIWPIFYPDLSSFPVWSFWIGNHLNVGPYMKNCVANRYVWGCFTSERSKGDFLFVLHIYMYVFMYISTYMCVFARTNTNTHRHRHMH